MCFSGESESGHGGRFEPCESYKRIEEENAALRQDRDRLAGIVEAMERMDGERTRLRAALEKAVADYGKPGGPWNVPSEPGTWLQMAKDALGENW